MGLAGADARPSDATTQTRQRHDEALQGISPQLGALAVVAARATRLRAAMDAMSMEAARSWHWMGDLEEDLAVPHDDNPAYDLRAVLHQGERDRLNGATAGSSAGDWIENPRGMPPAFVPRFEDVLNTGSPRPGTWIYLNEARVSNGPLLPVLRMVYWDQESETWRRFMATPDCIEPVTVPQPWAGPGPHLGRPPQDGQAWGRHRPSAAATERRDAERSNHNRRRRGPEFVRTNRLTMPPNEARLMQISVQAFTAFMLLENDTSGRAPAPTPEEVAAAAARGVREGIIEYCDSSSSEGRAGESEANDRRAQGGAGYRPVRSAPSATARRAPADPGPPARRRPRNWRYTDTLG